MQRSPLVIQEETNWCWAASSKCMLDYYNNGLSWYYQCEIAEYVRTSGATWHYYGTDPCCDVSSWLCNQGTKTNGGRGSIQDILCELGDIASGGASVLDKGGILYHLEKQAPFIIHWKKKSTGEGHAMVGYGIIGNEIHYMNPDLHPDYGGYKYLPYDSLVNNKEWQWEHSLTTVNPSSRDCLPCHCFNEIWDADKGELGVDCGGVCPDCDLPPLDHCSNGIRDADEEGIDCGGADCPKCTLCNNCKLDPGEDAIDCGGTCPPCKYVGNVTDEEIITNTTQLRPEVMAFNKITAGVATRVASGREVSFITKKTGSIVLLPGFTAEHGSNFSTQMKDLSQYERLCGGACHNHTLTSTHKAFFDYLQIKNLPYAVGIDYDIYKSEGWAPDPICSRNLKISSDGDHVLWNCIDGTVYPTGTVSYKIVYKIHYCNYTSYYSTHYFTVNYPSNKSSTEDSEDQNSSPQFSPSNPNDIPFPSATAPPHFVIIPNPNSGTFQLETNFPLTDIANLKIVNLFGVSVYETKTITEHTLQLQNSASGMFFVVIILKDGTVLTQKMVVQR